MFLRSRAPHLHNFIKPEGINELASIFHPSGPVYRRPRTCPARPCAPRKVSRRRRRRRRRERWSVARSVGFYFRGRRTRQVGGRRPRNKYKWLVLRAVKSRRLDLVSCSGRGARETRVTGATGGIEKFQGPPLVYHNYQGPPTFAARICSNLSAR